MLIISNWSGQNGNNILQIIRCIYYGLKAKENKIQYPNHCLLVTNTILLNNINNNSISMKDNFFNLKKFGLKDPSPLEMKTIFQKYIKPIFNITYNQGIDDNLFIHFRGGDIFGQNPHKAYVQPPLKYYIDIINNYLDKKVVLVCQDKLNPCINKLLQYKICSYESNHFKKDLEILSNIQNLVIGFGTFGFLIYLMNTNLKNLYIPEYFIDELPDGPWGDDVKLHIIDLPNYIKVGEWKNSVEQRNFMLTYR